MSIADIPQLQKLSKDEKLQIIEELWDSLDHDTEAWPMSDEEKAILDARLDEHEANPGTSLSLEEFKRQFAAMRPSWGARHGL